MSDDERRWREAIAGADFISETHDYLSRGRQFETVADDALKEAWATAFKNWLDGPDAAAQRDMNDLAAELGLRGTEPPYEAVNDELAKLRAALPSPDDPELAKALDRRNREFFDELDKPKN